MEKLYRFRSARALLEQFHELENHEMYFADYDSLNDPMEGFRRFVWKGNRTLWRNLLKHYVLCLYRAAILLNVREGYSLSHQDIYVDQAEEHLSHTGRQVFEEIIKQFFAAEGMEELLVILEKHESLDESTLLFYLDIVHNNAVKVVLPTLPLKDGIWRPAKSLQPFNTLFSNWGEQELDELKKGKLKKAADLFRSIKLFSILQAYYLSYRTHKNNHNKYFDIHFNFPFLYIEALKKLARQDVYLTCFMEECTNSASWGHYADSHKGACLIFKTSEHVNTPTLSLSQNSQEFIPHAFTKVKYEEGYQEVEFFTSIESIPEEQMIKQWYTDEQGNKLSDHIARLDWLGLHKVINVNKFNSSKFSAWSYEKEQRLILPSSKLKNGELESRKLKYDFNQLHGIIFGVRTSHKDKIEMIYIIEQLCRKFGRTEFEFYQAEPAPDSPEIIARPLDISLSLE